MNRRVPLHSLVDDVGAGWRPRRRQRRLALAAMALPLVLLLLAEGVVRLALDPVPTLELFVYRSYPDLPERRGDEPVFEGDPLLGWRLRAGLDRVWWDYTPVTTNDAHLRGGPVRPLPEGGRRILCLADSVTFGYRVPVVFPDEQVPAGEGELAYPRCWSGSFRRTRARCRRWRWPSRATAATRAEHGCGATSRATARIS